MLGRINPNDKDITIIGAGISGLLAAYFLLQKNYRVTLYEAKAQCGGFIRSRQTAFGLTESAAHSFRSSDTINQLCRELNIPLVTARTKKKYILRDGKMRRFPLNISELAALLYKIATAKPLPRPTMQEWARHHLGQAGLDYLITPLLRGIYAADAHDVLQEMVFPKLTPPSDKTLLAHLLSMKRTGPKPVMTAPLLGMEALVQALTHAITNHPNGKLMLNHAVTELPDTGNLIITTPSFTAAELLQKMAPQTAEALKRIAYVPLIAATVFADAHSVEGIGVLCGAHEKLHSLGLLFNSEALQGRVTNANTNSFTCMLGGSGKEELLSLTDDALRVMILEDLHALFGNRVTIKDMHIHRWPRALPLYNGGLQKALETADQDWCKQQGRVLFGNYTGQISLRGLCDTVSQLG